MQRPVNTAQFDFLADAGPSAAVPLSSIAGGAESRREHGAAGDPLTDTAFCTVSEEEGIGTLWVTLKPGAPVNFTPALLADLRALQERIASRVAAAPPAGGALRYQVFSSRIAGVFSLGGDLALFRDCIRRGDRAALRRYAREAVDLVHANATGCGGALTTISLVQGQALGGGFEAALAGHVLVAERGARMGLPEVLFNMFPGMGAWQLLCRRLPPAEAERMILGGRTWSAEELHALGVVDVLADEGDGENAVRRYLRANARQHHGHSGFRRARQAADALDREALYRMAEVWVDTALGLSARDLATIDYLLRAQQRMASRAPQADKDALAMEA